MDADGSYAPEPLPQLMRALARVDLVVGAGYAPGRSVRSWPKHRLWLSRVGNLDTQEALRLPVLDATRGTAPSGEAPSRPSHIRTWSLRATASLWTQAAAPPSQGGPADRGGADGVQGARYGSEQDETAIVREAPERVTTSAAQTGGAGLAERGEGGRTTTGRSTTERARNLDTVPGRENGDQAGRMVAP